MATTGRARRWRLVAFLAVFLVPAAIIAMVAIAGRPQAPTVAEAQEDATRLLAGDEGRPGLVVHCETPEVNSTWTCRGRDAGGAYGFAHYSMSVEVERDRPPGIRYHGGGTTTLTNSTVDGGWVVDSTGLAVAEWVPHPASTPPEEYPADTALTLLARDTQRALGLSVASDAVPLTGYDCPVLRGTGLVECTAPRIRDAQVQVDVDRIRVSFRITMNAALAEAEAEGVTW
ncbi:hypothetical protein [Millisia brevis]|uniref:hypothetical protein n=1 Tax=Millisia brevis TaxID=264148 RepID=UPI00082FF696|nr:hypothetical protein [Millisia brevis]